MLWINRQHTNLPTYLPQHGGHPVAFAVIDQLECGGVTVDSCVEVIVMNIIPVTTWEGRHPASSSTLHYLFIALDGGEGGGVIPTSVSAHIAGLAHALDG